MDNHDGLASTFTAEILADVPLKVVEYLAYNLLSNYASNTDIRGIVNKFDFYIFPIVNPDGMVSLYGLMCLD